MSSKNVHAEHSYSDWVRDQASAMIQSARYCGSTKWTKVQRSRQNPKEKFEQAHGPHGAITSIASIQIIGFVGPPEGRDADGLLSLDGLIVRI